jgi:hypothetical protein
MVERYLLSSRSLHAVVLNRLSTGTTLHVTIAAEINVELTRGKQARGGP